MQRAKNMSLDQVLEMDYHLTHRMLEQKDFYEGIRAAIIDKDKNPQWKPATLSEITHKMVTEYFA